MCQPGPRALYRVGIAAALDLGELALEARHLDELVDRRVQQPDGDWQPAHRAEDLDEVPSLKLAEPLQCSGEVPARATLEARILAPRASRRASSPAMNISRTSSSRSEPKNMCSVRHRPMPSAPSSRARAASSPVSALARTPSRRSSSDHARISPNASPTCGGIRSDLVGGYHPRGAVDRDHVAGVQHAITDSQRCPIGIDLQSGGAADAGPPHAPGDYRRMGGLPALGGEDSPRGMEAADVVGRGEVAARGSRPLPPPPESPLRRR